MKKNQAARDILAYLLWRQRFAQKTVDTKDDDGFDMFETCGAISTLIEARSAVIIAKRILSKHEHTEN